MWTLARNFGDKWFDSNQVSDLYTNWLQSLALWKDEFSEPLSIKRVSNDLGRLYRMSFLKRRRVSRVVASGYKRGYKYRYHISKQGSSYLEYLATHRQDPPEDEARAWAAAHSAKFPNSGALELHDMMFPPKPPSKNEAFWSRQKRSESAEVQKKQIEELARYAERWDRFALDQRILAALRIDPRVQKSHFDEKVRKDRRQ